MQEGPPLAGLRLFCGLGGGFSGFISYQAVIPAKAGSALLRRSRTSRGFSAISQERHSRERGLRFTSAEPNIQRLQRHLSRPSFPRRRESRGFSAISPSRHSPEGGLRFTSAEPNIQRLQRHLSRTSFPRTRAPLYFDGAEHPEASAPSLQAVIPTKTGSALVRRSRTSRGFSAISQERHSRERGNPVPFVRERLKSLDSRVRGNDGRWVCCFVYQALGLRLRPQASDSELRTPNFRLRPPGNHVRNPNARAPTLKPHPPAAAWPPRALPS
jgi:hypothetical protein